MNEYAFQIVTRVHLFLVPMTLINYSANPYIYENSQKLLLP